MSTQLIPNEKQLISGIKKDVNCFFDCANKTIKYAISAGEKLIELKKITPHGQWQNRFKTDFQDRFGDRQARRFMEIAEQKYLAIELNKESPLTIEQTIKAISDATPEQLEKANQLKLEAEEKAKELEAKRLADAEAKRQKAEEAKQKTPEPEAKKVEEPKVEPAQENKKEPEIIEGVFEEIKKPETPKDEHHDDPFELMSHTINDLQDANKELTQEIDSITRVLESNDQVAKAIDEVKRFREINRVLEERIRGLQGELSQAKQQAKYWKGQYTKLEKSLKKEASHE